MSDAFNAENFKLELTVTPKDLADLLRITPQALHKFLKEHDIDTKVGNTRFHKIRPHQVRKIIEIRGLSYPNMVIDLHNVKGGVGKSTCTHALATRAAAWGAKVLMVDLDQQANLTSSFGIHGHPNQFPTILDIHKGMFKGREVQIRDAILELNDNLHLIPSNLGMANIDTIMSMDSELNVGAFFDLMFGTLRNEYDFIFFDSPPALSKLTTAAHLYSDLILMPVEPDKFSIDGLELNFETIFRLKQRFGTESETKIFINKYDARPKIDFLIASELAKTDYAENMCESAVRYASGLKAAIAEGKCVWNADKKNPALEDLNSLFLEISGLDEKWNSKAETVDETTRPTSSEAGRAEEASL